MAEGNFKDDDKLNELRQRLYDRGKGPEKRKEFVLTDDPKPVPADWKNPPPIPSELYSAKRAETDRVKTEAIEAVKDVMAPKRTKKYRVKILLAGVFFFIFAVLLSSAFFMFGGNAITGDNIVVNINGPFTIGGGEIIPIQVGVTNQNSVSIDSATLIVTYPSGTQSATEEGKDLFVERLSLDTIKSGETLNIPLRAVIFGEENEEKIITAEVEYRIEGSNSTFAKKADEPLKFKIGSSPIVISVDALKKVSSGQETDITLTVTSNSPTTLHDILIKADYPTGFDFTSSNPATVSGQNVWLIKTLEPESDTKITLKGVVVGRETDKYAIIFSSGVSSEQDRLNLSSVFSTASTEFLIEQPFIGVDLEINSDSSGTVAIGPGEQVRLDITVKNTLEDTIYDGRVELSLSGNALSDYNIDSSSGFYDSNSNKVYWDASSIESLRQIAPGEEVLLRVSMKPDENVDRTPQLAFDVDARAKRVTEGNVTEELIGTAKGVVKVSSVASIITEIGRDTSTFAETGPLPPVAELPTTYTITLFVQNGSNDVGDGEVVAALPGYLTWMDKTSGSGSITFNETTRTVTWRVGDIDANQSKIAAFQVTLLPSVSQIGTTPTLLGTQRFRATDRFTGSVVRTEFQAVTTRLSEEAGYPSGIGEVQPR